MTSAKFRFEKFANHDRAKFRCGDEALDRYFQTQVTQDMRRRMSNCFVAIDEMSREVAGFYTLSTSGIPFGDLPAEESKRLPRYPTIPAVLLGRLAVDLRSRRQGLGEALLMDAVYRSTQDSAAAFAMLVDPKDEKVADFYKRFGFRRFGERKETMFLPLAKVQSTLRGA